MFDLHNETVRQREESQRFQRKGREGFAEDAKALCHAQRKNTPVE
jgi:hypothetical protein